jgi:hypothetical protein
VTELVDPRSSRFLVAFNLFWVVEKLSGWTTSNTAISVVCSVINHENEESHRVELEPNGSTWYWHQTISLSRGSSNSLNIRFKNLYSDSNNYHKGDENSHIEFDISHEIQTDDSLSNDEYLNRIADAIVSRGVFTDRGSSFPTEGKSVVVLRTTQIDSHLRCLLNTSD